METVTMSLERYEALKNKEAAEIAKAEALKAKAEALKNIDDMFLLKENYKNQVILAINVSKAMEIFKSLLTTSKYAETHEIVKGWDYDSNYVTDVAEYYLIADKIQEDEKQEIEELKEDEQ